MQVQAAKPEMAKQAAQLVLQSAPESLEHLLLGADPLQIEHYIAKAFTSPLGQFSYSNHYCIVNNNQLIAVATCWHTQLDKAFHLATIDSLHGYFGVEKSLDILARSQALAALLPAPTKQQLAIGHLAVKDEYKRQGMATKLMCFFRQQAKQQGKTQLVLDVVESNEEAIGFYQAFGFEAQRLAANKAFSDAGFLPHLRMNYSV